MQKSNETLRFTRKTYMTNGNNNDILLLPVVDDSPPSGGLAELDPVLITNLVRVL